jgi:hypothetical protein
MVVGQTGTFYQLTVQSVLADGTQSEQTYDQFDVIDNPRSSLCRTW